MTKRTVAFGIDGGSVDVPEMPWDVIEDVVMPILDEAAQRAASVKLLVDNLVASGVAEDDAARQAASTAGLPWYKDRGNDIRILAAAMRRPYDEVRRSLSMDEARDVSLKIGELLKISGFVTPGEAEAASGSTETSTGSSQGSSTTDSPASRSGTKSRGR